MVQVPIPTPLRQYTHGARVVTAEGDTLRAMLDALDRAYPGLKFRLVNEQGQLREHIRLFINQHAAPDLDAAVRGGDEIRIILAISGG